MATMSDVAAMAGVSGATVSRVLNGLDGVSTPTRLKVEEAVRAIGYRHNRVASTLASGRAMLIGVVLPLQEPTASATLAGILEIATRHGYGVLVRDSSDERTSTSETFDALMEHQVDGIIFADKNAAAPRKPHPGAVPIMVLDLGPLPRFQAPTTSNAAHGAIHRESPHADRCGTERLLQEIGRAMNSGPGRPTP